MSNGRITAAAALAATVEALEQERDEARAALDAVHRLYRCRLIGQAARTDDEALSACPHPEGSDEAQEWASGWYCQDAIERLDCEPQPADAALPDNESSDKRRARWDAALRDTEAAARLWRAEVEARALEVLAAVIRMRVPTHSCDVSACACGLADARAAAIRAKAREGSE